MALPRPWLLAALVAAACPGPALASGPPGPGLGPPGGGLIGTPVTPVLPTLGTFASATAFRQDFVTCASSSNAGFGPGDIVQVSLTPLRVRCGLGGVYDSISEEETSTTPGASVNVLEVGPGNQGTARASARANLLGANNEVSLGAGSSATTSTDARGSVGILLGDNGAPIGYTSQGGGQQVPVVGEVNLRTAGSLARLADIIIADGNGPLGLEFTVDGLYETGNDGFYRGPGGRVAFAAVLLDPTGLVEAPIGVDGGLVRVWKPGSFSVASFALGRNDGPSSFPSGEILLGSADLNQFAPTFSTVPEADLPNPFPADVLQTLTVQLDVQAGKEYWFMAGLYTSASNGDLCDAVAGDGDPQTCSVLDVDLAAALNSADVDFNNTARLTAVNLGGSITGLASASGVNYQLAAVPLPAGAWLLGTGIAALGGLRRLRRLRRG